MGLISGVKIKHHHHMKKLISVNEADAKINDCISAGPRERVPLVDAIGQNLAEDIIADRPLPPFNRSMMDGVAIQHASFLQKTHHYTYRKTIYAGDPIEEFTESPKLDEYIEIMTGAAVPAPFDCVVPIEDVEVHENRISIKHTELIKPQQFIHQTGSDYQQGEILLSKTNTLHSPQIPILASCGYDRPLIFLPPQVAIISTGDELVEIDQIPAPTQIRRSNHLALYTALHSLNIKANLYHFTDNAQESEQQLAEILESHQFVILSGGISKGKKDFIAQNLENLSVEKKFHGVSQRPGKPFWFGQTKQTYVFALPGNPISTIVCCHRYVLPAIAKYLGRPHQPTQVQLAEDVQFQAPLTYFLPVLIQDGMARPRPVQNSGDYASIAQTDGFIELPADQHCFSKGSSYVFYAWR